MLEIPESSTLARQLRENILAKRIVQVAANSSPHGFAFFFGDPALYPSLLEGKVPEDVQAIGGQVEVKVQDARIVLNDGINARLFQPGDKLPEKHQLLIGWDDGTTLVCTVQMYGGMMAFYEGQNQNPYYLIAKEKPSPLDSEFDEAYFSRLMAQTKKSLSAKAFLATEQRIPGLGNGVLQDVLFHAGIHPKEKLEKLSDPKVEQLFRSIKDTLSLMTEQGGRDTEKDLYGKSGGYKTILSKNTLDNPCPHCASALVRQAYLGGNIYFCPACQPLS